MRRFVFIFLLPLLACSEMREEDFRFAAYNFSPQPITIVIDGREVATVLTFTEFKARLRIPREEYGTGTSADYADVSVAVIDARSGALLTEPARCSFYEREVNVISYEEYEYGYQGRVRGFLDCGY